MAKPAESLTMQAPYSPFEQPADRVLQAVKNQLPTTPLVSVVMTAYNAQPWLQSAAQSILSQTWPTLELLIVDDCSSDHSRECIREIAQHDSRVRPIWMQANGGTYLAKNAALRLVRGDAVTFMDSDDTCTPDRLERQLAALCEDGVVATTCNYERRTPSGQLVLNNGLPARQALISLMVRRGVIDDLGGFDAVRHGADDEYFERVRAVYGRSAHRNVNATLYNALVREGSLSNTAGSDYLIDLSQSGELPPARAQYKQRFVTWHERLLSTGRHPHFPLKGRSPIQMT